MSGERPWTLCISRGLKPFPAPQGYSRAAMWAEVGSQAI